MEGGRKRGRDREVEYKQTVKIPYTAATALTASCSLS